MGVSVAEGTVVEWRKRAGDAIAADEIICAISTDKIDTDVESPASGVLAEVLVAEGETVEVGVVLARIDTGGGGDPPPPTLGDGDERTGSGEATAALQAPGAAGELQGDAEPAPAPAAEAEGKRGRYSPVVLRIAQEHGVQLDGITGTGRGGSVRKQDVLAEVQGKGGAPDAPMHIESPYRPDPAPASAPAPAPGGQPLSRMRRSIGEHMHRSLQTAAHCTTIVEADMSAVEAARSSLGLTYLPFVARCAIAALREFPALNAWLEGDTFTQHEDVNLGIAVSLGDDGLIVPVVRHAQDLSAEGLGRAIRDLARRARSRELTPDDVRDGTFTITNPGAFGAVLATPIINQPQVAILDLEAVVKRPVVVTDAAGQDAIAIRPMTNLCMSWDHRALDGAVAARFLSSVARRIEGWDGG